MVVWEGIHEVSPNDEILLPCFHQRFHSLAVDGDQTISREEYVCACKKRTEDLKAKLEVQFSSEDNANRLREVCGQSYSPPGGHGVQSIGI